ncbi:hypothetical protein [Nonomuraea wenchangensis]|uniref:Uncharacterized protein n=1 Tax=Nonomuraea wenchangensis TaxID=568860 RepID=A0A1I0JSP8_9ACTN|nr:hypothetical protein [Nonomuraea wenchangensis]SEU12948.1 hypothetical protein SAMN05421811_106139 [Nonomuraea wenchangensis]
MTDPIVCPECGGQRGQLLGPLFLACRFCGGRGQVGGSNEPAERGTAPPPAPPPAWKHKVWTDPYISAALGCRACLGARTVAHVDEESGTLVTAPCGCAGE